MTRSLVLCGALALLAAAPAARAQDRPAAPAPRRPARPDATSPQVVTVRPREPLRFDAQLVVPSYYDRDFWPAIRAGVELVGPRPLPAGVPAAEVPPATPRAATRARPRVARPPAPR